MWFLFDPDTSQGATRQERVFRHIRDRILSGELPANSKLPSTRELAERLGLSRNTVSLAYEWLVSEGYLEARQGAGTFVASVIPDLVPTRPKEVSAEWPDVAPNARVVPVLRDVRHVPVTLHPPSVPPRFDFRYGSPDPRHFPLQAWRRLASERLSERGHGVSGYVDPAGLLELRRAIARQLAATRGVHVDPQRVVITCGAQEGLSLIAELLTVTSTTIGVEVPGYGSAVAAFEHHGADILPVPLDDEGLRVDALPECGVAAVYVTPSHQFPTGITMSIARRVALLAWAQRAGSYVIEDDYDSDYRYEGPPLAALAALDRDQRVIYLGSFSKALGAGLRVGFVVLPNEMVAPFCRLKRLHTYGQSWLDQAVLASYMDEGAYERRLRKLRRTYMERRNAAVEGLRTTLPWTYTLCGADAGMHFSLHFGDDAPPTTTFLRACAEEGVRLYGYATAGVYQPSAYDALHEPLVFGYSLLSVDDIQSAMVCIQRAVRRVHRPSGP